MSEFVSREICPSCKQEFVSHANQYINQLRAEVDALRKDKERLDWLLDQQAAVFKLRAKGRPLYTVHWLEFGGSQFERHSPRDAIDAAMAAKDGEL